MTKPTEGFPVERVAASERAAARERLDSLLRGSSKISVGLFQPIQAAGLQPDSPGAVFDVTPLPRGCEPVDRELLYTCARAGNMGAFLQNPALCLQRTKFSAPIDVGAIRTFKDRNGHDESRRQQIHVEGLRHAFKSQNPDEPPENYWTHHLALAPNVLSFENLSDRRIPLLGTLFTVSAPGVGPGHPDLEKQPQYANMVDYATFLGSELLVIRAANLLGGLERLGDALESILGGTPTDDGVQLAVRAIFSHHWFFPYDPTAYALIRSVLNDDAAASELYRQHGWLPPRDQAFPCVRKSATLHETLITDIVTLVQHLRYQLGGRRWEREEMGPPVQRAVNTALLLLCGEVPLPARAASRRGGGGRSPVVSLRPSEPLTRVCTLRNGQFTTPAFPDGRIRNLIRGEQKRLLERMAGAIEPCRPGQTTFSTRTHLKPALMIEGFAADGTRRSTRELHDTEWDQTRWICFYAVARLTRAAVANRPDRKSVAEKAATVSASKRAARTP